MKSVDTTGALQLSETVQHAVLGSARSLRSPCFFHLLPTGRRLLSAPLKFLLCVLQMMSGGHSLYNLHERTSKRCFSLSSSPSIPAFLWRRSRSSASCSPMSHHACSAEGRGSVHLGPLLTAKSSPGILRLFLGFSDGLEFSRKGFALAPSKVYCSLLLIDLDCPRLQLLLFDLNLVVERTSFVCRRYFQSLEDTGFQGKYLSNSPGSPRAPFPPLQEPSRVPELSWPHVAPSLRSL